MARSRKNGPSVSSRAAGPAAGSSRRKFLGQVGLTAAVLSAGELSFAPVVTAQAAAAPPDAGSASGAAAAPAGPPRSTRARTLPRLRELGREEAARPAVPARLSATNESVIELRLALVCYGGVSLAIYMHGITKELETLVVASRGFEASPDDNPFPADRVEHHYWRALRTIADATGVSKRVVIDIVAGTSAGGINGVFLAKALARNLSQAPLTDLWFTKGDIWKLLGGNRLHDYLHLAAFAAELPLGKARPPLDGDAMYRWLVAALAEMDATPQPIPPRHPLAPAGQPLQLFVTTTDYYGYPQQLLLSDPPMVTERWSRDILEFSYPFAPGPGRVDAFGPENNPALAFAARATSSFPGAFPPFSLPGVERNLDLMQPRPQQAGSLRSQLFRRYELAGAEPEKTFFIDGGVLDNYPFQPAIDAIVQRSSAVEVDRRLIFLDPAPEGAIGEAPGKEPSFFGTIWAGLSSLPSAQPILDQLLAVRDFNARVKFVNAMVDASSGKVEGILLDILKEGGLTRLEALDMTSLGDWRLEIEEQAVAQAGYLYDSYFELRVLSVLAQFATAISLRCRYPAETNAAYLVELVIEEWARRSHLLAAAGRPADKTLQLALLKSFDLGFSRRRLAFVIQRLNQLYSGLRQDTVSRPTRAEVNEAKAVLYGFIDRLNGLIGGDVLDPKLGLELEGIFGANSPFPVPPTDTPIDTFASTFLETGRKRLDALHERLGDFLLGQQAALDTELMATFNHLTSAWEPSVRRDVLVRYLGFPFWDALIYPTTKLSHAGELRELAVVRFSPNDAKTLETGGAQAKLQGVKAFHFGAFFKREARENDYLWGRLDASDRIFHLLFESPPQQDLAAALRSILHEESTKLHTAQAKIAELNSRLDRLQA